MQTGLNLRDFKKYHLGCGTTFLPDYLNIGWWTQLQPDMVYKDPNGVTGTFMLNHDLAKGIPAGDASLDVIYHSHFLEHLSYHEGIALLKECHRCLVPGGIHRIVVPDLALWIRAYHDKDDFFFQSYRDNALADEAELYQTRGAIFMGMLHNHGHKCGWDYDMLEHTLKGIGFKDVRRVMFQDSALPDIAAIEPYAPLRAMESLCVECRR